MKILLLSLVLLISTLRESCAYASLASIIVGTSCKERAECSRYCVCPELASPGTRVMLNDAFPIKEHRCSLFQVISRPGGQFRDGGIAGASKGSPGLLHLMSQLCPFGGIACHTLGGWILRQIPDKNPIQGMGCPAEQWGVPVKAVHPDGRSLAGLGFCELDRREDKLLKGQQREQSCEQRLFA